MCKRKKNISKIKDFQRSLNIRVDYYSIPGSVRKLVETIYKGDRYEERKPTEEEMQIVDYDGVASCMNTTITELLFHPCHIIAKKDDERCTIYIHRNFISIQYNTKSSEENDGILNTLSEILTNVFNGTTFNVQDICCRLIYSNTDVVESDVWKLFDRTAFPVMEEANMINGSYIDTHRCGDYFIDLSRNISPASEPGRYDVIVATTALCSKGLIALKDSASILELLKSIKSESENEITRCYTE